MTASYQVRRPYLKNHKLHDFNESLRKEKRIIETGEHLSVIHQLNIELQERLNVRIDYDTFEDNYGTDSVSLFKNKAGVDATFNLIHMETGESKEFTLDYKFRDPNAKWDDFLAETVSQDFGYYSNKMPVPGWAVCNHKINDGILYVMPGLKKAALVRRKELKSGFEKSRFPMNDRNKKIAKNKGWNTISYAIDWERLIKVCPSTIIFNYE